MKILTFLILATLCFSAVAQQRIDSQFAFQTDPAKKYSVYIPSGYVAGTPHSMMLGLHPFNTNRWDAESWCDTLTAFAETNNLLLVCPDGGTDGQVDDAIDTAFTTTLLDSMMIWYSVDADKVYAMGFSWGGQTTYTYGLSHINRFGGFMPIGSVMSGTNPVSAYLAATSGTPFYLVHGSNDSPGTGFEPIRDALINNGAIVNTNLLAGVGHTIDFPNRNSILTTGFQWIDSVNCAPDTATAVRELASDPTVFRVVQNHIPGGEDIRVQLEAEAPGTLELQVLDRMGRQIAQSTERAAMGINNFQLSSAGLRSNGYLVVAIINGRRYVEQFYVH